MVRRPLLALSLLSACAPASHLSAPPSAPTTAVTTQPKLAWTVSAVTLPPEKPHVPERAVATTLPPTTISPGAAHEVGLHRTPSRPSPRVTAPPMGRVVPPESVANCESGGDPTAVSANGKFRGKWQFSVATWRSVGGTGDPAAASEAEQDYRAGLLWANGAGRGHWPTCGRRG